MHRAEAQWTAPEASGAGAGRLRIRDGADGPVLADVPAHSLSDEAPLYDRPLHAPVRSHDPSTDPDVATAPADVGADLLRLMVDPSWVYRQYDHQLFLNTVEGPGGDATVLRLAGPGLPPSRRGLALTTDSNPRWCALEPRAGTALVVAEAVLNLACVGAAPVAVVNCLNFGNPEHPEVMWQLSEAIDGLSEACRVLGLPVIGGNVSLYNESAGLDIRPTPVIGALGLVEELAHRPPGLAWEPGTVLMLLGHPGGAVGEGAGGAGPLGGSRWAIEIAGREGGSLPSLSLADHARVAGVVRELVAEVVTGRSDTLRAVHDVSSGGLGVALAEMAAASGYGAVVEVPPGGHAAVFGESPGRVVVATRDPEAVERLAADAGVQATGLGRVGGDRLVLQGMADLPVDEIRAAGRRSLGEVAVVGTPGQASG